MSIQSKTYDVVYYDEDGKKEIMNSFATMDEAMAVYFQCVEGDKEAQINMSYDIEENYVV
jgi:hypothetical protein|tara:strand:+ start:642 stop:821 length:180 start_codon:yes stop_codon:yes gene_type:complete